MGIFDTGSTCLNLPRGLFNDYYKSSLFDNFAALASTNPTLPMVITLNDRVRLEIPQSSWSEPWACTYPFTQDNVVLFGHHVFRAYMVVHDMNPPHYHMGFAKISPSYKFSKTQRTVSVPLAGQRPFLRAPGLSEVAKVPLMLEQRVHLFVSLSLGTPPQTFRCVFDTGSVLLAVFSGNVSTDLASSQTKRVMHVDEPPRPPKPAHIHRSKGKDGVVNAAHPGHHLNLHAFDAVDAANRKEAAAAQAAAVAGSSAVEHITLCVSGGTLAFILMVVCSRAAYARLTRRTQCA